MIHGCIGSVKVLKPVHIANDVVAISGSAKEGTLSGENLSGETIRRAKFLSPKEKFVTFARRKILPDKNKRVLK